MLDEKNEIEILTNLEYNRLMDYSFNLYGNTKNKILGFYDSDLNLIKIGNIKNSNIAIKTLIHESIHKTLNLMFNKAISHNLDSLIYLNPKKFKKLGLI